MTSNNVLIFDDNTELLEVLVPLLEMNGFVVEARGQAAGAIEATHACAFDVIVYNHDHDQQGGGLFQLQLTAYPAGSATRVIAYTASTDEAALGHLKLHHIEVLTRPLSYDRLLRAIQAGRDEAC